MSYYHYLRNGDIIIDHGNSNFKDSRRRMQIRLEKLIQYLDCGTSGGVYGLEAWILSYGWWFRSLAVSVCSPIFRLHSLPVSRSILAQIHSVTQHLQSTVGFPLWTSGAGHFVKMVHNGVEYGIMQAYAEGFNILQHANAGTKYTKEGDALRCLRCLTRRIINTILMCLKWPVLKSWFCRWQLVT